MYYRPQGYRPPRDMRIPINYSGNAFIEHDSSAENEPETYSEAPTENSVLLDAEVKETEDISDAPDKPLIVEEPKSAPSSLLGNVFGKIGTEELLIIALVFLLSDNDSENDIIWLLLLLLFIK